MKPELDQDEETGIYTLELASLKILPRLDLEQANKEEAKEADDAEETKSVDDIEENKQKEITKPAVSLPKEIDPSELSNIDIESNLVCLLYLHYLNFELSKDPKLMLKMNPQERKNTRVIMNTFKTLENQLMNEEIEEEEYKGNLKKQIEHDKILLDYFEKIRDTKKISKVKFRLEVMQRDLEGNYTKQDQVFYGIESDDD